MNRSYKTCLYYNSSCLLFAASRPYTVSFSKKQSCLSGRIVQPVIYIPAKRMFSGLCWNQPVGPSVHVKTIEIIHNPLNDIVLTGHVLRRSDLSNMTHHRPLGRGKYYTLISSAQWRKNGYYHLHFGPVLINGR